MSSDDSHSGRHQSDSPRHPESGLFERIREWNDVFPWLRLTRTLRLAGSPPLVSLTFLCLGLWWLGESLILGDFARNPGRGFAGDRVLGVGGQPLQTVARLAYLTSPSAVYQLPAKAMGWRLLWGASWSLLIWTPIALLLTRQGGLLAAGRPMMGLRAGVQHALARMLRAWVTALVPTACVVMIAVLILMVGKAGQWVGGVETIESAIAILVALMAVVAGLLAFGAHFAIPLGWAALANEQSPDPLDSLSRGYEYLLRRPLHLMGYLLLSLVLMLVIWVLVSGVSSSAIWVVEVVLGRGEESQSLVRRVAIVLSWFPVAAVVTLGWGLVGGVYLLLRCNAGGQEVEDIWVPPAKPRSPFPSLPNS